MSSLPESGTRTPPPPASAVQEPEPFTSEQFVDYLNVRGDLLTFPIHVVAFPLATFVLWLMR
jgi:hypothetical protein